MKRIIQTQAEHNEFIAFMEAWLAGQTTTLCAFCGNAPATETTTVDDRVCHDCKQAFEDALDNPENDESENEQ